MEVFTIKKLSKNSMVFLAIQALFGLATALSSTYVSVYMWKLTSNMTSLISYNIVEKTGVMVNFILASHLAKRKGINSTLRIGIISQLILYILILLLKGKAASLLMVLGLVSGIGSGFYFYAVNNLIYYLTDNKNRGYFLGVSGALTAIMGTLAPLISGYIISKGDKFVGYYKVFFCSFILFTLCVIFTVFLENIIMEKEFKFKRVYENRKNKYVKVIMCTHTFLGLRDGAFTLALSLITYNILKNEFNMGKLNVVASITGIVSTYIVGYILNKRNMKYVFLIGVVMNIVSTFILFAYPSFIGIVINAIMNSMFNCFWSIPSTNLSFKFTGECGKKDNNVGDYMIAREFPLALGRVISLIVFAIISINFELVLSIRILLLILSCMLIPAYIINIKFENLTKVNRVK